MAQTGRSRTATFLVRLWVENEEETESAWRGQVEHVQSGEKRYVREISQMVKFIEDHFEKRPAGAGESGIR